MPTTNRSGKVAQGKGPEFKPQYRKKKKKKKERKKWVRLIYLSLSARQKG
jgi:hypothetical protein